MDSESTPPPGSPAKSTGSLNNPAEPALRPEGGPAAVASRPSLAIEPKLRVFLVGLAELAVLLSAVVGAVALGLGITDYFRTHVYIAAYLVAYAGFRIADLLVREEQESARARRLVPQKILDQLPVLALFAAAPFERTYVYGGEAPPWAGALGLLLELLGLWLALGARIQLGFFTAGDAGQPRPLVRTGFYRYIRYPIYSGEFMVLVAWPFEYWAPAILVCALFVGWLVIRRRIQADEVVMVERFGEEYRAYMHETDRLIPNLW